MSIGIYIPIPGTDMTAHVNALQAYLPGLGMQDAASKISTVMDAYPAASAARGTPYVKDSAAGEWMASKISQDTGLTFGVVKAVLTVLQTLAGTGKVSASYYNPGAYSLGAKVSAAVTSAAKTAKTAVQAATPDSLQSVASGLASGLEGLGDLASMLPLILLGVGGWWLYNNAPKGRRA